MEINHGEFIRPAGAASAAAIADTRAVSQQVASLPSPPGISDRTHRRSHGGKPQPRSPASRSDHRSRMEQYGSDREPRQMGRLHRCA